MQQCLGLYRTRIAAQKVRVAAFWASDTSQHTVQLQADSMFESACFARP